MYTHVSLCLGTPFAGDFGYFFLVGLSLVTALFFWLLTLSSCYLTAHPCVHSTPVMPPSHCSQGLHLPWCHLVLGSSPLESFPLDSPPVHTFLVTPSLISNLPTFRFLFVPSWPRLHLLHLQLSLGIPSCVYAQDEDSLISLLLVSPCSSAPNPSASSTALMATHSQRQILDFFSAIPHPMLCARSVLSLGGVFHAKFNIHCFTMLIPHTSHLL